MAIEFDSEITMKEFKSMFDDVSLVFKSYDSGTGELHFKSKDLIETVDGFYNIRVYIDTMGETDTEVYADVDGVVMMDSLDMKSAYATKVDSVTGETIGFYTAYSNSYSY